MTDAERWFRERFSRTPQRDALFTTLSGEPVEPLYGPEDVPSRSRIGFPGEFPFTRGVYPSMYRGRLWTMRQFAGFGTAEETNERFRYLLDHGQTGLSTAFDMPSLMGHDSDHPRSEGEVGREGVAIDTLDDMETLFGGIDMGEVSTSMTINAPAAVMLAFYVVAAERQGVGAERLAGTIQTDILKEYIAQKEWCFPIDPAMRLVTDMVEFCARRMPRWHPISISGYHIREAGSTAQQELAFTLKDGFTYVEEGDRARPRCGRVRAAAVVLLQRAHRLLRGDRQVPRGAADLGARAARHLRRARRALAADALPHPDRGRVADRAAAAEQRGAHGDRGAAAVLGGTQSLHTNSLRRGAGAAHRGGGAAGAAHPADHRPRDRRDEHDRPAGRLLFRGGADRSHGGARPTSTSPRSTSSAGWSRRSSRTTRSARSPTRRSACRRRSSRGERIVVGVNRYQQAERARDSRSCGSRPSWSASRSAAYRPSARGATPTPSRPRWPSCARRPPAQRNLMEPLLDCARAHGTEGEIIQSLQRVFGTYTETPVF